MYFYKIYKSSRTSCIITRIQYCNTLFFTIENGRQYRFRFLYIKQFTCNKSGHLTNPGFFFLSIGKTGMNIHVQVHRMKNQQRVSARGANPGTNYCMCRILWAQVWKKWQYNISVFRHICWHRLVANCFQHEEQRQCLDCVYAEHVVVHVYNCACYVWGTSWIKKHKAPEKNRKKNLKCNPHFTTG